MKILCLYNNECAVELFGWLKEQGHETVLWSDRLDAKWCKEQAFDLTVSYTYRYIISEKIINSLKDNVVNIHNSMLPWNRGADPNLWSIVENTPRGVTLHYINAGLDKGPIIAQEVVDDTDNETLKSSYNNLDIAAKAMFKKAFKYVDFWQSMKKTPVGNGSYHSVKDGEKIKSVIDTYDLSITEFRNRLKEL